MGPPPMLEPSCPSTVALRKEEGQTPSPGDRKEAADGLVGEETQKKGVGVGKGPLSGRRDTEMPQCGESRGGGRWRSAMGVHPEGPQPCPVPPKLTPEDPSPIRPCLAS